jgi:hypothetical protein
MWDFWRTKWHWGRFSPSTLVSPIDCQSTNAARSIIIPSPTAYSFNIESLNNKNKKIPRQ